MSNAPRVSAANRNWGSDDSGTNIMHVDMDAFFASVEVSRKPALRGKPVVIGGGDRSVVVAATYEARALGVRSGMPAARARLLAPNALFLRPDHALYQEVSTGVMQILKSVTPEVEQVSVDEAFLDVTGSRRRLGNAIEIGQFIRQEVERAYGITCSVGIARNKFVAKLASTNCKPDGLMLIPADRTVEFVQCLPVGALWGVGQKTQERLEGWGITQVRELAQLEHSDLARMVGEAASRQLRALAWGEDERSVVTQRVEKSVGAETTFDRDLIERDAIISAFWALADQCGARLRARGLVGRTVAVKVRNASFETVSRSSTLKSPTNSTKEIFEVSRELFGALNRHEATRLVGIRIENLEAEESTSFQDTLFESDSGSSIALAKSEQVMDLIRAKFGPDAIERAAQGGVRLSSLREGNYP